MVSYYSILGIYSLVHSHSAGIVKYVTETINIIIFSNGMEIEETKKKTCTSKSI